MIITHSIHIQLFYSYSSLHSIHHIQSSHNQSVHFIIQVIHSRDSNQFLSFHITINQTSILILHHSYDNSDPQLRHSTLAHFIHFNPHSLSFISHYSTIFYYHLFIPIQYYWIQSRGYHSHHSFNITLTYCFHFHIHSHIISILFIFHNHQ